MIRVFVGGTGRSGTTIFSRWLGSNQQMKRVPQESRFIVDSGGMIDLYENLTESYSHDRARVSVRRFFRLMEHEMVSKWSSPYVGFDFDRLFAKSYRPAIKELRDAIIIGSYQGSDFHSGPRISRRLDTARRRLLRSRVARPVRIVFPSRFTQDIPIEEILVCRKFSREELAPVLARFIDALFGEIAKLDDSEGWCEDTPANALHVAFLLSLFPESKHIHMTRNPYGVAHSYTQRDWAPSDFRLSVKLLAEIYKQIISVHESLSETHRKQVKTVQIESLAREEKQREICDWIGVDPDQFNGSVSIRQIEVDKERANLSPEEVSYVDQHLGFASTYFGYTD